MTLQVGENDRQMANIFTVLFLWTIFVLIVGFSGDL